MTTTRVTLSDDRGNTFTVEVENKVPLLAPTGSDLVGTLWAAVKAAYTAAGYRGNPVEALGRSDLHGQDFEDYFNPSAEEGNEAHDIEEAR